MGRPRALWLAFALNCGEPAASETIASDAGSGSTSGSDATSPSGSGEDETSSSDTTEGESTGNTAGPTGPLTCTSTEDGVRKAVLEPHCSLAGCHDGRTAAGALDLITQGLERRLALRPSGTCDGETLLVPGDPNASFLLSKLNDQPGCGDLMPPGGALDPALLTCVADWIAAASSSCETCGGANCVDVTATAEHCGDCMSTCPPSIACVDSECACPDGTRHCGDACVDTLSDPAHCGGCDGPCDEGLFCLAGACSADCGGLTECGGACVNLNDNLLHCGDCDTPCAGGETCSRGSCGCDAPPTSYARDVEPFLVSSCASMGCHRPMGPNDGAADLNLASGSGFAALVDAPSTQCAKRTLVAPGSPASSYLVDKVAGINLCFGTKMPKNGPGLTPEQQDTISNWICAGASP